jgi:3-hydroxyisobutyrate dehydrogenase-like beta-hydroxyacid dehydrogenase
VTLEKDPKQILLLHPGAMGHVVGACLVSAGHRVAWVSSGRSPATAERASDVGLIDYSSLPAALQEADVVLSICPPDKAIDVAIEVATAGFSGLFIDANAISPATARQVEKTLEKAGASMVDGGIVGPPPTAPGRTRLFLSGSDAAGAAALFHDTALQAIAIGPDIGGASALKMTYAAWTKGTSALFLAIRALARAEGIEDALIEEWRRSQPSLVGPKAEAAKGSIPKAWRFAGEMREIADSFAAHSLPSGFHLAAAEVFEALSAFKDESDADLDSAVARLVR